MYGRLLGLLNSIYYEQFLYINKCTKFHLLTGGSDQNAKKNEQVITNHSRDCNNDDCRMGELPHGSIDFEGILLAKPNTVACNHLKLFIHVRFYF